MRLITIESKGYDYLISVSQNGKAITVRDRAGSDPANAAAMAVRSAMQCVGNYCIIAPEDVRKNIPPSILAGSMNTP